MIVVKIFFNIHYARVSHTVLYDPIIFNYFKIYI